jgi:tetratricopeptide (TPR) repeat protein
VSLPIAGSTVSPQTSSIKPAWQRWNDYGIGCFLEGGVKRGHFKQAEEAFKKLLTIGVADAVPQGHLNLARVYLEEGRLDEAAKELEAAGKCDPPAAAWSRAWFTALVNSETATRKEHLDAVITDLEKLLDPAAQPKDRGFDFTKDYVVWNTLANRLFKRRQFEPAGSATRRDFLGRAILAAERVLELDAEDVMAHDLLAQAYGELAGSLAGSPPTEVAPDWMLNEATAAADPKQTPQRRTEGCANLAAGLSKLSAPKLATMREIVAKLRPAFHAEGNTEMQSALAEALAKFHREFHGIYKPDEIARSNATRIYRQSHPAANYAAGDRVIYPTLPIHRDTIVKTGELPPAK